MGPAFGQEFFGSLTRDFLPYKELLYCVFWVSAGACGPDAGFPIMTSPHFTQVARLPEGKLVSIETIAIVGVHVVCLATVRLNIANKDMSWGL